MLGYKAWTSAIELAALIDTNNPRTRLALAIRASVTNLCSLYFISDAGASDSNTPYYWFNPEITLQVSAGIGGLGWNGVTCHIAKKTSNFPFRTRATLLFPFPLGKIGKYLSAFV